VSLKRLQDGKPDTVRERLILIASDVRAAGSLLVKRYEPPDDFRREVRRTMAMLRSLAQCAGPAPPHAAGDMLSGVAGDRETSAFFSAPAGCVGGVPLTRARKPWAMPEAST